MLSMRLQQLKLLIFLIALASACRAFQFQSSFAMLNPIPSINQQQTLVINSSTDKDVPIEDETTTNEASTDSHNDTTETSIIPNQNATEQAP